MFVYTIYRTSQNNNNNTYYEYTKNLKIKKKTEINATDVVRERDEEKWQNIKKEKEYLKLKQNKRI